MLSVSDRDTDNTDRTDKTITRAGVGLDLELVSGWAWRSEQAQASGCRSEWGPESETDSAPDSDSVFDSAQALVGPE